MKTSSHLLLNIIRNMTKTNVSKNYVKTECLMWTYLHFKISSTIVFTENIMPSDHQKSIFQKLCKCDDYIIKYFVFKNLKYFLMNFLVITTNLIISYRTLTGILIPSYGRRRVSRREKVLLNRVDISLPDNIRPFYVATP